MDKKAAIGSQQLAVREKQVGRKTPLQRARAIEYASHYECRRYFLSLPGDLQERYRALSMVFPEWDLNRFGAIQMDDHQENQLIHLANMHGLQAWYLISIYTSEDGWNKFVGKFNALEERDQFREPEVPLAEIWMAESTKEKLSM